VGAATAATFQIVVGDDAQSIYSFRAAEVCNILDFPAEFPEATVVTLETNYRSTQPILDVTNRIIGLSPKRHAKELRSARHWLRQIAVGGFSPTCFSGDIGRVQALLREIHSYHAFISRTASVSSNQTAKHFSLRSIGFGMKSLTTSG
jgi:superfamily I DNA/RNA helicase